jgi:nitrate reductase cytochrome c-type subunit
MTTPTTGRPGAKPIKTVLYIIGVIAVVLTLYVLSQHPEERPALPTDADHRGITDWHACLDCHGDDGPSPLIPTHPINKEKCMRCHQPDPAKQAGAAQ